MNQNQKFSILENHEYRADVTKRIASIINSKLDPKLGYKISDDEINQLINNKQMLKNYADYQDIKEETKKKTEAFAEKAEDSIIKNKTAANRYGYLLSSAGNEPKDISQNREILLKSSNTDTSTDMCNDYVLSIVNQDLSKVFPKDDAESIAYMKDNMALAIGGFLFTDNDLLGAIKQSNPELKKLAENFLLLFQGNENNTNEMFYKSPLCMFIPQNVEHATDIWGALLASQKEITNIINELSEKTIEFSHYATMSEEEKSITFSGEAGNYFNKLSSLNIDIDPKPTLIKKLYEKKILTNGIIFEKQFQLGDKFVKLSEALNHIDLDTCEFKDGLKLVDADKELVRKAKENDFVIKTKSNYLLFKQTLHDLENNEYYENYDALKQNIEKIMAIEDEVAKTIATLAENSPKGLSDIERAEYKKLSENQEFINLNNEVIKDRERFRLEQASLIIQNKEKNKDYEKVMNNYNLFKSLIAKKNENIALGEHKELFEIINDYVSQVDAIVKDADELKKTNRNQAKINQREAFSKLGQNDNYKNIIHDLEDDLNKFRSDYDNTYKYLINSKNTFNATNEHNKCLYLMNELAKNNNPDKATLEAIQNYMTDVEELNKMIMDAFKDRKDFDPKKFNQERVKLFNEALKDEKKLANYTVVNRLFSKTAYKLQNNQQTLAQRESTITTTKKFIDLINDYSLKNQFPDFNEKASYILAGLAQIDHDAQLIANPIEKDIYINSKKVAFLEEKKTYEYLSYLTKNSKALDDKIDSLKKAIENENLTQDDLSDLSGRASYTSLGDDLLHLYLRLNPGDGKKEQYRPKELDELNEKFKDNNKVKQLTSSFSRKLNPTAAKEAIKAIALINIKKEQYSHRWKIAQRWYRNSYNEMLHQKDLMVQLLENNGYNMKNIDKLGLDDKQASYGSFIVKEQDRIDYNYAKFEKRLKDLHDTYITLPLEKANGLNLQIKELAKENETYKNEIYNARKEFINFYKSDANTTIKIENFNENDYPTFRDEFKNWLNEKENVALKESYNKANKGIGENLKDIESLNKELGEIANSFKEGKPYREPAEAVQGELKQDLENQNKGEVKKAINKEDEEIKKNIKNPGLNNGN